MMNEMWIYLLPGLAVVLDLALGTPQGWWHPVRLVGSLLDRQEALILRLRLPLRVAGVLAVLINAGGVYLLVRLLTGVPWAGWLIGLYFAYAGLALGQLLREGRKVANYLNHGYLDMARKELAGLLSRETAGMDEQAMRRALGETLSENLNDGFIAPFLFLCIGGPALMWAYKVVSTMDSMWGYREAHLEKLGWAAARGDDVLAFIPARITAFCMLAAGYILRLDVREAYEHVREDALKCESPNAGWPMAAAAWLLRSPLGGPAIYFGELRNKPLLGPGTDPWSPRATEMLLRLVFSAGMVAAVLVYVYFAFVHLVSVSG